MSIRDLLARAIPEARYYDYDRKIIEDYDNRGKIYSDAYDKYKSDFDIYQGKVDDYNLLVDQYLQGDGFGPPPPVFQGGDEPVAPVNPDFSQGDVDAFVDEAAGRATRRGQTAATAFNVLSQGGNFATAPQVQGGAGVSTVPEFSFSGTGFADGGGVGEFFQRFNPLTGSYRKETPLSVKAMEQAQDFTPVGTAETVREIYKESQEEDPNKAKMGIMALAELAGYAPAVGPGAKQAVRMMMSGNKKLPDDVIQKMKEQQIRVMEEELKDGVVIMRDRGEPERKIEDFVKKKRGDIFEARGLPRDMDDFYAEGGVVSNNEDPSKASESQKNLANKLIDAAISAKGVRSEAKKKFIEGNYAEGIAEYLIGVNGSIPVIKQIYAGVGQALLDADSQGDHSFGNVLKNLLNPNNSISFVTENLGFREGGVVSFAPYLR